MELAAAKLGHMQEDVMQKRVTLLTASAQQDGFVFGHEGVAFSVG